MHIAKSLFGKCFVSNFRNVFVNQVFVLQVSFDHPHVRKACKSISYRRDAL
ncbi:hypothetical protein Plhal304r1_c037g0112681 [Plasmopara halstedii]